MSPIEEEIRRQARGLEERAEALNALLRRAEGEPHLFRGVATHDVLAATAKLEGAARDLRHACGDRQYAEGQGWNQWR